MTDIVLITLLIGIVVVAAFYLTSKSRIAKRPKKPNEETDIIIEPPEDEGERRD